MDWRVEAKRLEIPMWHREKKDVLAAIAAKKSVQRTKIVISGRQAQDICNTVLMEYVKQQGLKEPITHEKWCINCKRKGIVFTGVHNDSVEQNPEKSETENAVESGLKETESGTDTGTGLGIDPEIDTGMEESGGEEEG